MPCPRIQQNILVSAWTQRAWSGVEQSSTLTTRAPGLHQLIYAITFWYFLGWIDLVPFPEVWVQLLDWKSWIWRTTISMKSHYLETFLLWVSDMCNEVCEIHFNPFYFSLAFLPWPVAAVLSFAPYRQRFIQTSQPANNIFIFSWLCRLCPAKLLFTFAEQLRALYLGDNDFETLPPEIGELRNLQVVN